MRIPVCAFAAAVLAGCATLEAPFSTHLASDAIAIRACADWYRALDAQTGAAGVRDAQEAPLAGFPYLRANRLLAARRAAAAGDERVLRALVDGLVQLDLAARRHELANLPQERLAALPGPFAGALRGEALARTRECARLLRDADLASPQARELLLARVRVPDAYSVARRLFGLYFLTRVPFAAGVRRWQEERLEAFQRGPAPAPGSVLVRYAPPGVPGADPGAARKLLARAPRDALGIPELSQAQLELMLAVHAPSFEVEIAGDHDRFGRLRWTRESDMPVVDASEPAVYTRVAYTLYRGRVLLQLVYTVWFPERPPQEPGDIYAGLLDGVVWRVTLAPDGEPLVYDSMHPCGCFHEFFPTPRATPLPAPDELEEWAFVPQRVPRVRPGERPVLRIATRTHYIERVTFVSGADSVARYTFRAEEELRSLARPDGGRRGAFGRDGLIAGTERAERVLFWPMGIVSAGAMRQWGRHATAFVGRRHFDDPDLLEKRFVFDF